MQRDSGELLDGVIVDGTVEVIGRGAVALPKTAKAPKAFRFTEEFVRRIRNPQQGKQQLHREILPNGRALQLLAGYKGTRSWSVIWYEPMPSKRPERQGKLERVARSQKLGIWQPGHRDHRDCTTARSMALKFQPPQAADAAAETFRAVAEDFLRRHVEARKQHSAHDVRRYLNKYVLPRWGERKILDLKRSDAVRLSDELARDHGNVQSDHVLASLRSLFAWYATRCPDEDWVSPIPRGLKADPRTPRERARQRTLDAEEIRALWTCTAELGAYGGLLRFLLVTGARLSKGAELRFDDIDANGVWKIRTGPRRKATPGTLPLPPLALQVVRAQPPSERYRTGVPRRWWRGLQLLLAFQAAARQSDGEGARQGTAGLGAPRSETHRALAAGEAAGAGGDLREGARACAAGGALDLRPRRPRRRQTRGAGTAGSAHRADRRGERRAASPVDRLR